MQWVLAVKQGGWRQSHWDLAWTENRPVSWEHLSWVFSVLWSLTRKKTNEGCLFASVKRITLPGERNDGGGHRAVLPGICVPAPCKLLLGLRSVPKKRGLGREAFPLTLGCISKVPNVVLSQRSGWPWMETHPTACLWGVAAHKLGLCAVCACLVA